MKYISELKLIINKEFNWNNARVTCFVNMLLAIFTVKTVNLVELSCVFASNAKPESRYKRLQRFFKLFKIDFTVIAGFIFKLFLLQNGKWYLTIDRTNWKFGKKDINVLMLAIAYEGIAIPIFWKLLNKQGNSDTAERIELIKQFTERFLVDIIADAHHGKLKETRHRRRKGINGFSILFDIDQQCPSG